METGARRRGDDREQELGEGLTPNGTALLQSHRACHHCHRQEGFWTPVAGPVTVESFGCSRGNAFSTILPVLQLSRAPAAREETKTKVRITLFVADFTPRVRMLLRKAARGPKLPRARCGARGDGAQPWQAGTLPGCVSSSQPSKDHVEG